MKKKLKVYDWTNVINGTQMTDGAICHELATQFGLKYSPSGIWRMRMGQTKQPSHEIGQGLLELYRQGAGRVAMPL